MATLIGTSSNNSLTGTSAADTMIGQAGNDQLVGNGGNDRLNGGVGNDLLNGGDGSDTADFSNMVIGGITYIGATAGVTVNLNLAGAQNTVGAGTDTLTSIENLIGTNFNDALAGNGATNVLTGLSGNDIMAGAAGNDQLSGGDGNDLLNGGVGNDLLDGGAGTDTADYGTFTIGGQAVSGATTGVTVNLNLTGAQNTVGAGTDTLVSIENLTGSIFNDALAGNGVANVVTGREGNDILAGAAGNDTLTGDTGNDLLNGGVGNDVLNGGIGTDTADYGTYTIGGQAVSGATAGVTVNLNVPGAQNTGGAGSDTLVGIENLTGSDFNDTLTGNSANNVLTGRAGDDIFNGGLGNDLLQGDSGNDLLDGGDGIDTASYATATVGVTVELGGGAQNTGGAGIDTLLNIENLTGSNFNDTFTGSANGDGGMFNGGLGNDSLSSGFAHSNLTLNGGAGDDRLGGRYAHGSTLNGDEGDDDLGVLDSDNVILNGGTGNDSLQADDGGYMTLNGGAGNDSLLIYRGYDSTMNGGAGADTLTQVDDSDSTITFEYTAVSDSPAGSGKDIISGFSGAYPGSAIGDRIDLTAIDANDSQAGNQAFTYIGSAAFTAAGQLRYAGGLLQGSTDADTAAEFEIQLVGSPPLAVGGAGTDILL
ncbi:MAG: calcium-binding protein [Nitrospira sp.]